MSTATPAPETPLAPDPAPWQEPPPYSRRKFLAVMGGFGALAVGAAVLGGDLLSPPATTGDGDFAGERRVTKYLGGGVEIGLWVGGDDHD